MSVLLFLSGLLFIHTILLLVDLILLLSSVQIFLDHTACEMSILNTRR